MSEKKNPNEPTENNSTSDEILENEQQDEAVVPSSSSPVDDIDSEEDDFFSAEEFAAQEPSSEQPEPLSPPQQQESPAALEPEPSTASPAPKKKRAFLKPLLIICCSVVILMGALFTALVLTLPANTVANNVYVEDLDLSGLSYNDALAAINATYLFKDKNITVSSQGQTFVINGLDVGLIASPEETAQKAFEYTKSTNQLKNAVNALKLKFTKHILIPVAQIDQEKLGQKLNEFGIQLFGEMAPHTVEIEDSTATVIPGHTGYNNDPSIAIEEVISSISKDSFQNIPVTLLSSPPEAMTVEKFDQAVYRDPVDAHYEINNNKVEIVPGAVGRSIDKEASAPLLQQVHEGGQKVQIPIQTTPPEKTQAMLKEKLFSSTLATYSTTFGAGGNRGSNVSNAASRINGTVIAPGGTFSFNDTVGKRTIANGFKTAPEYLNGQTVDGIGGGTCQVSTTLYSAVLYSGLKIAVRSNHSMSVGYVPLGQDATVTDGGTDFKFKNNTDYPVKVVAGTNGGTLTVSIVGTQSDPPKTVKLSHQTVSSTAAGTSVRSTRTFLQNGEVVETESLGTSFYKPHATKAPQ